MVSVPTGRLALNRLVAVANWPQSVGQTAGRSLSVIGLQCGLVNRNLNGYNLLSLVSVSNLFAIIAFTAKLTNPNEGRASEWIVAGKGHSTTSGQAGTFLSSPPQVHPNLRHYFNLVFAWLFSFLPVRVSLRASKYLQISYALMLLVIRFASITTMVCRPQAPFVLRSTPTGHWPRQSKQSVKPTSSDKVPKQRANAGRRMADKNALELGHGPRQA